MWMWTWRKSEWMGRIFTVRSRRTWCWRGYGGGRGRGEAQRLTPARPSTRARHAVFPSWTTCSIDHVLSERGNGGKCQRISVARPSFSKHRAGVLEANTHMQPNAPQMVVLTDSGVREEMQCSS